MKLNPVRFGAAAYVDIGNYNWLEQRAVQSLIREKTKGQVQAIGYYGSGSKAFKGNTWEFMVVKAPFELLRNAMAQLNQILQTQTGSMISVRYVENEPNDKIIREYETAIEADGKHILA